MTIPQPSASVSLLVYASESFTFEQCNTCSIPGYLIVTPRPTATSLSRMTPGAVASLGSALALATRAIETVVRPERVYCALFAEQSRIIHFHLFPRTAWLTEKYLTANPDDQEISGPRLMDWARRTLRRTVVGDEKDEVAESIRVFCRNHDQDTTVQT